MTTCPVSNNADIRRGKARGCTAPMVSRWRFWRAIRLSSWPSRFWPAPRPTIRRRAIQLIRILERVDRHAGGICAGQGLGERGQDRPVCLSPRQDRRVVHRGQRAWVRRLPAKSRRLDRLGARIGEAFQVADDLRDALYDEATLGKPAHQDEINGRPNAVSQLGVRGAIRRLGIILSGAISSNPVLPGRGRLVRTMVRKTAERLTPSPSGASDGLRRGGAGRSYRQ